MKARKWGAWEVRSLSQGHPASSEELEFEPLVNLTQSLCCSVSSWLQRLWEYRGSLFSFKCLALGGGYKKLICLGLSKLSYDWSGFWFLPLVTLVKPKVVFCGLMTGTFCETELYCGFGRKSRHVDRWDQFKSFNDTNWYLQFHIIYVLSPLWIV